MLNAVLVAPPGPVALAASVYPVPTLSILTFANVATPLTAATLVVPASVPPPGLAASARVTSRVEDASGDHCPPRVGGGTAGVTARDAVVLPGCTANRRWVAPPGETLNAALVGDVSPVAAAVRVYPVPALSALRSP